MAVGSYAPAQVITNADYAARLETTDEWITSRTGIRERRRAAPGETSSRLGVQAVRDLTAHHPGALEGVNLVICATSSPDAMFPSRAFDELGALVASCAAKNKVNGQPEEIYEPLDHIEPGLPRTLIHVSGSEVLLHDAQLAASRLAAVGVPAEVRVWPGQVHDFQVVGPLVPEAVRSLRQIGEYIREATG